MKILYLEDDINLSQTIEEFLIDEGFDVVSVYNGNDAQDTIYEQSFDLWILDVNVPGINGFKLLEELRDAKVNTPAIYTTSLSSMENLSTGYNSGADDYLKKPFALQELLFRIKALLKREYKSQDDILEISQNMSFNTKNSELISADSIVVLNPKEASLLTLLLKHKNECVSLETIYHNIWSYDEEPSDMSLRTYIKNLRKYISKEKILSIKKVGYKLV